VDIGENSETHPLAPEPRRIRNRRQRIRSDGGKSPRSSKKTPTVHFHINTLPA
jgi:hypothetical protein